ncbi:MAG: hypothetical protein GWN87_11045 [Desulfuromonadales bacterium]|nr:hypothetical protein [Desulfuromonadales bacterium]NIS40979.1 hypothetical protein [Desulfuromonadales bacterium]
MQKKPLLIAIFTLVAVLFLATSSSYSQNLVASLDDQEITKKDLAKYVEDVAGSSYESLLSNNDGLRKLADFYINRVLLLDYAKQQVEKDDSLITNHDARRVSTETMYLTALLKTEVHEKAQISQKAIEDYLKENQQFTFEQAQQKLESERKQKLMEELIDTVRSGHSIRYF